MTDFQTAAYIAIKLILELDSNLVEIIQSKEMQIITEEGLVHLDGEPNIIKSPIKLAFL